MQSTETWRPIAGYEGVYEVSDHGRIRSLARYFMRHGYRVNLRDRIMKPYTNELGYQHVDLRVQGVRERIAVHRAVAAAFIGDPTELVVRHKDDNPSNNHLSNLELGTQKDNMQDASIRGRINPWCRHKTHCKRGHEFNEENTRYGSKGERICKPCNRAYQRAKHAAKRAALAGKE